MELFRVVDCTEYVGAEPKIPALRIQLTEPVFRRSKALIVPIDTGFAGYLLVPRDLYDEFGTLELPRDEFGTYSTLAGPIVLRRARVLVGLGNKTFETYIETPIYGVGKLLAGRRLLRRIDLALLGKKSLCCYLELAPKAHRASTPANS